MITKHEPVEVLNQSELKTAGSYKFGGWKSEVGGTI